jgi:hypothetical protein
VSVSVEGDESESDVVVVDESDAVDDESPDESSRW